MRTPFYYLDQFSRFPARRKREKKRAKSAERATRFRRAGQHMHLLHIVSYMFPCACTFYMYMFPLDNKHPTPPVRQSVDIRDVSKSLLVTIFGRENHIFLPRMTSFKE